MRTSRNMQTLTSKVCVALGLIVFTFLPIATLADDGSALEEIPATFIWSASGSGAIWSDSTSWTVTEGADLDGVPDENDLVVFDSTSVVASTIDRGFSIRSLRVTAGYTGVLRLGAQTLTMAAESSAEFTVASAGSFDAGGGTVRFTGGITVDSAEALYDLEVQTGGYGITLRRDLLVNNLVHFKTWGGLSGEGILQVAGDVVNDAPGFHKGTISFVGSTDQTWSGYGAAPPHLDVSKPAGDLVIATDSALLYPVSPVGERTYLTGSGGRIRGTISVQDACEVDFAGSVDGLTLQTGGYGITLRRDLLVNNLVHFKTWGGLSGEGVLQVAGDVVNDAPGFHKGTISFVGSTDQTWSGYGAAPPHLDVSKPAGDLVIATDSALLYPVSPVGERTYLTGSGGRIRGTISVRDACEVDFAGSVDGLTIHGAIVTFQQDFLVHGFLAGDGVLEGNVTIITGGVAPSGLGILCSRARALVLAAGSSFDLDIGGTSPGSGTGGHDQLIIAGQLTIQSEVSLNCNLYPGYQPSTGDVFVIIDNQGSGKVSGTFAGLPEGAKMDNFLGSGLSAAISYVGGDGNDVILEVESRPIAMAGPDQSVHPGTVVTLDGSGSSDPDGDYPLTFDWQMVSRPAGSTAELLVDSLAPSVAKIVPDVIGNYEIQLVVTDSLGTASLPDAVIVSTLNTAPVADAGQDQAAHPGTVVTLDGSGSSDPDGDYPLTFDWQIVSRPAGSTAELLVDPLAPSRAVIVPDVMGDYEIQLVATDSLGTMSLPDTVIVSTLDTAPVADAGPDQALLVLGTTVQLDGTQSYDDEGDSFTFAWTLDSVPAGSAAVLDDPTSPTPSFVADVYGSYVATLVVTDIFGASSEADSVELSFANLKPVADAGGNQAALVGKTVILDGSGSHDANLDPLTFEWGFVSRPDNSTAALTDPTAVQTTFVPDQPGEYVVSLVVNDGSLDSDSGNITITAITQYDAITEIIMEVIDTINALPAESLKNENLANALTSKLNAALSMLDSGAYGATVNKLEQDLLSKTDGCASIGEPDANDWIRECDAQARIYPLLVEALELIRQL